MVLYHGVKDDQQLSEAGGESHLFRLPWNTETLVEVPEDRVASSGHQGSHVQGSAQWFPPTPQGALASQGIGIPVEGCYPHQVGNLLAVEGAQLGKAGYQGGGDD